MNPEHADDKFSSDQAETHMVKLVDGKLVPTANTESIGPDSLMDQFANDEEMAVNGPMGRTYDTFERDPAMGPPTMDMTDYGNPNPDVPTGEMIPTPPDPSQPIPGAPDAPTPPAPVPPQPEITPLPGTNQPGQPEITDPTQPGRSHEVNNG